MLWLDYFENCTWHEVKSKQFTHCTSAHRNDTIKDWYYGSCIESFFSTHENFQFYSKNIFSDLSYILNILFHLLKIHDFVHFYLFHSILVA